MRCILKGKRREERGERRENTFVDVFDMERKIAKTQNFLLFHLFTS